MSERRPPMQGKPIMPGLPRWWRSQSKLNRRLCIASLCFVLYSLTGFFLLPAIIKAQLLKRLPPLTHRQAKVAQVRFNPYVLSLTIRGLELTETNGLPFASWQELYINFQASSLFRWAWTFDEISLKSPQVEVILGKDGQLNLANIAQSNTNPPSEQKRTKSPVPRLLVQHLQITNATVNFADLTRRTPFRTTYYPITLQLQRLATRPNAESPLAFEAESDTGRHMFWSGNLTVQPFQSSGQIRITGIQLPRYAPYLEDLVQGQVVRGTLDVSTDYRVAAQSNGLDITATNLSTRLADLEIKDPTTGEIVIRLPSCEQRDGSLDYATKHFQAGSILLKEFAANVRRQKDGVLNLVSLLAKRLESTANQTVSMPATNLPPTSPKAPWTCSLRELRFEMGAVEFEDAALSQPFRTTLKPILAELKDFSTRADSTATVWVELSTEAAEKINLSARAGINPVQARGSLAVNAVELKKYQPYLVPFFRGQIADGKTDLSLEFQHRQQDGKPHSTVSNLSVSLSRLDVRSPDKAESVAVIPSLKLEQGSIDLEAKTVTIGAIRSRDAQFLGRRTANGALNVNALLPPPAKINAPDTKNVPSSSTKTSAAPGVPPDWSISLGEFAVTNYALKFEDQVVTSASVLALDQIAMKFNGVAFPSNNPIKTELSLRMNEAGTVALRGTTWLYTPAGNMEVDVRGLDLRAAQPYLAPFVRLGIASGNLNLQGQAQFSPKEPQQPMAAYKGTLQVTNLLVTDQVLFKEFVRWNHLTAQGIDLSLKPDRLNIDQVQWNGLKTSLIIGPDKKPNIQTIFPEKPALPDPKAASGETPSATASTNAVASSPAKELMPITIPKFILQNASVYFADQSITPNCVFEVEELSGTVSGISSAMNTEADVQLTGRIDAQSPFAVTGKGNPLAGDLSLDLVVSNRNTQLTAFTPYMEKFAGYPLNKGTLTTQLRYEVRQKALKAENKILIDQLTLGPKNDSPDATRLPLKLALALLKDRNGRIELDLPLSGRTDDPKFKMGPLILQVLMNVLTKAITSPFALLGSLAGGGGEELSYVDFQPGSVEVPPTEAEKLVKLSKALYERPALNLEILGSVDPEKDAAALKRSMLDEKIKAMRIRELTAAGTPVPAPEQFQLETNHYHRLILEACLAELGPNALASLSSNLVQVAVTNATIAPTNQVKPPEVAPAIAEVESPKTPEKGATLLLWRVPGTKLNRSRQAEAAPLQPKPELSTPAPSVATATNVAPSITNAVAAIPASTFAELETMLLQKIEVTDNQLRELMQKRAQNVQAQLLKTEKVTPQRLFLLAPKPLGTFKGETRVNLSLN